jgi:hypothetical protein
VSESGANDEFTEMLVSDLFNQWLRYGDEQYPKIVVFRNMLSATDFLDAIQNAWAAGKHVSRMPFNEIDQGQMNPHGERKGESR